jgi:hypothetical protein
MPARAPLFAGRRTKWKGADRRKRQLGLDLWPDRAAAGSELSLAGMLLAVSRGANATEIDNVARMPQKVTPSAQFFPTLPN